MAGVCAPLFAPFPAEAGAWSRWMKNDCYAAIEYRVRHLRPAGGDRHQWAVDIRNRSRQPVYFNWVLTEQMLGNARLNNQMSLRAGVQLRRNAITGAGPRVPVRLVVGQLRLGATDAPEQQCDQKK